MDKKYLNTAEAATFFNVTVQTIRRWQKENKLPCLVVGKTRRFSIADIQEFVRRHSTKATEA